MKGVLGIILVAWMAVAEALRDAGIAVLVVAAASVLVIAVKPEQVAGVLAELRDQLTDQLIEAANATREVFFTRTVLNGRSVLRFSIGGHTTEQRHVLSAWGMLQKLA